MENAEVPEHAPAPSLGRRIRAWMVCFGRGIRDRSCARVRLGFLGLLLFALVVLKMLEVMATGWQGDVAATLGFGLIRRLDDAVYWLTIAYYFACGGVFDAADAGEVFEGERGRIASTPWRGLVVFACAWAAVYVAHAYLAKGTFFWLLDPSNRGAGWFPLVALIQFIEGFLHLGIVWTVSAYVWLGAAAADDFADKAVAPEGRDKNAPIYGAAGSLLGATFKPLLAVTFLFLVYKAVKPLATGKDVEGAEVLAALGAVAVYSIPFLGLLGYCRYRWEGRITARIRHPLPSVSIECEPVLRESGASAGKKAGLPKTDEPEG